MAADSYLGYHRLNLEKPEQDWTAMSDDIRFTVPDELVGDSKHTLRYKFPLLLVEGQLKNAGQMLYVATNASAKNVDVQNKIQDVLFDLVKICDSLLLVLTSFKMGAKDIVEALRIAYLYLVDGFPDMAFSKMDSLQTTMEGMRARVGRVTKLLSETKLKLQQPRIIIRSRPRRETTRELELCLQTLDATLTLLDVIEEYCGDLGPEVDKWLRECREIAQPQMIRNRRDAERLSQGDQKKYWKDLMNNQDVIQYLARWRALSFLCEEYKPTIKTTRNTIDSYYTKNLMPNEAIKQAWMNADQLPIANGRWKALLAGQDLPPPVEPEPAEIPDYEICIEENPHDRETQDPVEQNVEDDQLKPRGGSIGKAVYDIILMSFELHGIESYACGIFCGMKKNPHNRRFTEVQKNISRLLGKPPMEKQPKSATFHGIVKCLDKYLGLARASESVETSARQYSKSLLQGNGFEIKMKPVAKALKKLNKSVKNLVKEIDHVINKIRRDLGETPKHPTADEDKQIMENLKQALSEAMRVAEIWMTQINKCTKELDEAKRTSKNKKDDLLDEATTTRKNNKDDLLRKAIRSCRQLKKMLEKEIDLKQQTETQKNQGVHP